MNVSLLAERARRSNAAMKCTAQAALFVASVVLGLYPALGAAQEIRYVYDPKGHLVGVIDLDGSAATWTWDENGNLMALARTLASSLPGNVGITLVSPNQ